MSTYSVFNDFSSPNFSSNSTNQFSDISTNYDTTIYSTNSLIFQSPNQIKSSSYEIIDHPSLSHSFLEYQNSPSSTIATSTSTTTTTTTTTSSTKKPLQIFRHNLQGTGLKGGFLTSPIAKGSLSTAEALALIDSFSPIKKKKPSNKKPSNTDPLIHNQISWLYNDTTNENFDPSIILDSELNRTIPLTFGQPLENLSTNSINSSVLKPSKPSTKRQLKRSESENNASFKYSSSNQSSSEKSSKHRPPPLNTLPSIQLSSVCSNDNPVWTQIRESLPSPAFSINGTNCDATSPCLSNLSTSPATPKFPLLQTHENIIPEMEIASISIQSSDPCAVQQFPPDYQFYQMKCVESLPIPSQHIMTRSISNPNFNTFEHPPSSEIMQQDSIFRSYDDQSLSHWNSTTDSFSVPDRSINLSNIWTDPCLGGFPLQSTSFLDDTKKRRRVGLSRSTSELHDYNDQYCLKDSSSLSLNSKDPTSINASYWKAFQPKDQFLQPSGDSMPCSGSFSTEEKPFTCPIPGCNAAFVRSHDLRRHDRIHSGTKTFQCPCGKWFGRGDALTIHRKRGICVGSVVPMKPLKGSRIKRKPRGIPEISS